MTTSAPHGELRGGDAFVPLWDIDRGGPHPAGHRVRVWLPDGSYIGGRRVSAQRASGCACSLSDDGEEILEWCSVHAAARDRTPPLGGTAGATVVGDNWLNDVSGLLAGMGTPRSHDLLKQLAAFTALKNGAAPPAQSVGPSYQIERPDGGFRERESFTDAEKKKLRPMAETIAMLAGNAFFGMELAGDGEWYEQYLPEAFALYESNGGDSGYAGTASFATSRPAGQGGEDAARLEGVKAGIDAAARVPMGWIDYNERAEVKAAIRRLDANAIAARLHSPAPVEGGRK